MPILVDPRIRSVARPLGFAEVRQKRPTVAGSARPSEVGRTKSATVGRIRLTVRDPLGASRPHRSSPAAARVERAQVAAFAELAENAATNARQTPTGLERYTQKSKKLNQQYGALRTYTSSLSA